MACLHEGKKIDQLVRQCLKSWTRPESLSSIIPTDSAGCEPNALVKCEHGCTLQKEGLDIDSVGEECETDEMSLPGGYIGGAQVDCSEGMTAETN